ncbi:MAG: hypothetical protein ACYDHZ_07710 [Dehalococcoidia bacterium]|jgi:hypothetical protein
MSKLEEGKITKKSAHPLENSSIRDIPEEIGTGGDRLGQIQDILFGAQREEYDKRITRVEELLVTKLAEMGNDFARKLSVQREEYDKRLARLEELLVTNVSDLNKKLEGQKEDYIERLVALEKLASQKLENERESRGQALEKKADKSTLTKLMTDIIKIGRKHGILEAEGTKVE